MNVLQQATNNGTASATVVAQGWRQRVHHATYRAILRRGGGHYVNEHSQHNFNTDLSDLFMGVIDADWNRVFNWIVARRLDEASARCSEKIIAFQEDFLTHIRWKGASDDDMDTFRDHINLFNNVTHRTLHASLPQHLQQSLLAKIMEADDILKGASGQAVEQREMSPGAQEFYRDFWVDEEDQEESLANASEDHDTDNEE